MNTRCANCHKDFYTIHLDEIYCPTCIDEGV